MKELSHAVCFLEGFFSIVGLRKMQSRQIVIYDNWVLRVQNNIKCYEMKINHQEQFNLKHYEIKFADNQFTIKKPFKFVKFIFQSSEDFDRWKNLQNNMNSSSMDKKIKNKRNPRNLKFSNGKIKPKKKKIVEILINDMSNSISNQSLEIYLLEYLKISDYSNKIFEYDNIQDMKTDNEEDQTRNQGNLNDCYIEIIYSKLQRYNMKDVSYIFYDNKFNKMIDPNTILNNITDQNKNYIKVYINNTHNNLSGIRYIYNNKDCEYSLNIIDIQTNKELTHQIIESLNNEFYKISIKSISTNISKYELLTETMQNLKNLFSNLSFTSNNPHNISKNIEFINLFKEMTKDKKKTTIDIDKSSFNIGELKIHSHSLIDIIPKEQSSNTENIESKSVKEFIDGKITIPLYWNHSIRGIDGINYHTDLDNVQLTRNVGFMLVKKLGMELVLGHNVMNIDMPIAIFDKISLIQMHAHQAQVVVSMLNHLVTLPNETEEESIDFFSSMVCWILNIKCMETVILKPFNPIWGETQNCQIGDQKVAVEQILHHPPCFNFIMTNSDNSIRWQGINKSIANISINHIEVVSNIKEQYEINGKKQIIIKSPNRTVCNFIFGKRGYFMNKKLVIYSIADKLLSFTILDYDNTPMGWSRKGLADRIWTYLFSSVEQDEVYPVSQLNTPTELKKHNIYSKLCREVYGLWTGTLFEKTDGLDKPVFNHNDIYNVYKVVEESRLPSDSNMREDLQYWKNNDEVNAENSKTKLVESQRHDRKIRKKDYTFISKDTKVIQF